MWFLLIYLQIFAAQGLDRLVLRGSDSPCRGRLEVFYRQEWGLVCHYGWNDRNAEVVCKSLGCGGLVRTDKELTLYKDPPPPEKYWMDHVECSSKAERLEDCFYVIPMAGQCKESFVAVECAGSVRLRLNMNGQMDKCAGVVQFSTQMGVVGICNSGWDEDKANRACKELNCGESHYISKSDIFQVQPSSRSGLLQCLKEKDNTQFLWQCMKWPYNDTCSEYTSVICTEHRRFRLQNGSNLCSGSLQEYNVATRSWVSLQQIDVAPETVCAQMSCGAIGNITHENTNASVHLTCPDDVKLRNFTSACFGSVDVVVNGTARGVCYSDTLSRNLGKVVCRELKCGEVLDVKQGSWIENGWLSNVECQGDEESLWHCLAKHQNTKCQSTTVICSDSLEVHLSDGFSRCSGRAEVKLEGSWKSFSSKDWTIMNSDVVCKHLECGGSSDLSQELFIEGKQVERDWMVQCESSSAKLHECLQKSNRNQNLFAKLETKEIICQKEELMFFEGDQPCQGRVRKLSFDSKNISPVKHASQNNETASRLCKKMRCGSEGVFENNTTTQPIVKCAGSVSVTLSNPNKERCWGTVEVCRDDGCGGVCRNTWRTHDSEKLCGNLGCGDPVKTLFTFKTQSAPVRDYSVYCSGEVKNLSMCNFVPNENSFCSDPASVICKDSIKVELVDPRDKCAGNVTLFYAGKRMPVCKDSLDKGLQNTVCRELNCGQAESVDVARYGLSQTEGLSGIECERNPDSVAKCNLNNLEKKDCVAGYLKCSGWTRLFLYKNRNACSGPVHALSSTGEKTTGTKLVSNQGWTKEEGQVLCEYLQCGNYKNHSDEPMKPTEWWNKTYDCSGKKNIWECERDDQKIIEQKQLNITCDGEHPEVTLSSPCTGDMLINKEPVCAVYVSKEKELIFNQLCNNMGCGKAIQNTQRSIANKTNGWYFSCIGHETFLWQCYSWKGTCDHITSVACQKIVQFSTTEKCGGFLGVKFRNQWEYVCADISDSDREKVCEALDCKNGQTLNERQLNEKMAKDIQVTVTCPEKHQNMNQCVRLLQKDENEKCQNRRAEITCEGHVEKTQVNVGLIVGVLLGILGLLGVISQRNRLSALRRYRKKDAKDKSLNANEMNNMETADRDSEEKMSLFEKDDYEEVDAPLTNRKGEDDADDKSAGSTGTEYDDIEEQAHDVSHSQTHDEDDPGLPLLPKRPETLLDEVTYEVEIEGEQDYDDAMPGEPLANENARTPTADPPAQADAIMDAETNANIEVVEVDVHAQPE